MKNKTNSEIFTALGLVSMCIGLWMAYKPLVFIFLGIRFLLASMGCDNVNDK